MYVFRVFIIFEMGSYGVEDDVGGLKIESSWWEVTNAVYTFYTAIEAYVVIGTGDRLVWNIFWKCCFDKLAHCCRLLCVCKWC